MNKSVLGEVGFHFAVSENDTSLEGERVKVGEVTREVKICGESGLDSGVGL
jgi:hypothetical protein